MIDEVRLIKDLTKSISNAKEERDKLTNDSFYAGTRGEYSGMIRKAENVIEAIRAGAYDVTPEETHFDRIAERWGSSVPGSSEQAVSIIEGLSIRAARSVLEQSEVEIKAADSKKALAINVKKLVKSVLLSE